MDSGLDESHLSVALANTTAPLVNAIHGVVVDLQHEAVTVPEFHLHVFQPTEAVELP